MTTQIDLGGIVVDVIKKDIKNIHLSVYPPTGRVRISAPRRMSLDAIRVFAISKLDWIKKQRSKVQDQDRETPREYIDRESHYLWGKRYLLRVTEKNEVSNISITPREIHLQIRPDMNIEKRAAIMDDWYRHHVKEMLPGLIKKWEPIMGVNVSRFFVQRMKTRWGSCNTRKHSIRLNTDLAKKPFECLEYVVVHEMVHLLEPSHNKRFVAFMDQFLPQWKSIRDKLNNLPVRHENWSY